MSDYRTFLEAKVKLDHACGFDVADGDLNPALKDHTRAMVRWALHGGRRALFAAFEHVDRSGWLPSTFMLMPPQSWHPDVWTDITRMRTLNGLQAAKGKEMHLCPLQFDIVDRVITQFSTPGETVLDPFAGLGTVPYCAVKLDRRGVGIELNPWYFRDAIAYLKSAEAERAVPTLFNFEEELAA